jgi:hypothetical protein
MRQLAAYAVVVMALCAAPAVAGPAEDIAAATKARTDRFSSHDLEPDPRPARFSFTCRLRDGEWLIADHHSSSVPAAPR